MALKYGALVSRQLVTTSWEETSNSSWNKDPSVVLWPSLEGWSALSTQLFKLKGFEVWSTGDLMTNAIVQRVAVNPPSNSGSNWLHLTDGVNKTYQTLGVERSVDTIQGATYTLQFNYAGDLGLINNKGLIGVYVDNQLVATYNNISGNTALDWQALSFQFVGNGNNRNIRIQLEGGTSSQGRGAMLDNIRVIETLPQQADVLYAIAGQSRSLPIIQAYSPDQDGLETLKLQLSGLAQGVVITDGTHYFTANANNATADISTWNLQSLRIATSSNYCGDMVLKLIATTTEPSTGATAQVQRNILLKVLQGQAVETPFTVSANVTPIVPVQPSTLSLGIVGSVQVLGLDTSIQLQVVARIGSEDDELSDQ